MAPIEDTIYDIYDPSAGSGSLVLHLANELGMVSLEIKLVFIHKIFLKIISFLKN